MEISVQCGHTDDDGVVNGQPYQRFAIVGYNSRVVKTRNLQRVVNNDPCGHSYKPFMIVIYDSRFVLETNQYDARGYFTIIKCCMSST